MVYHRHLIRQAQPSWRLAVGDDVHLAMLRKKPLQRPQVEQKFRVVPVAARHIAKNGQVLMMLMMLLGPGGIGCVALI